MADCPLADECPSFQERIEGMGCQHYGDRGGAEWCQHYSQPIRDLKSQPVQPSEELVVDVHDIHESGAGIGRTEDGFIIMVDGILPDARARVKITRVKSNHALAEPVERLPLEEDEEDAEENEDVTDEAEQPAEEEDDESAADDAEEDAGDGANSGGKPKHQRLGSRDNFWGS